LGKKVWKISTGGGIAPFRGEEEVEGGTKRNSFQNAPNAAENGIMSSKGKSKKGQTVKKGITQKIVVRRLGERRNVTRGAAKAGLGKVGSNRTFWTIGRRKHIFRKDCGK